MNILANVYELLKKMPIGQRNVASYPTSKRYRLSVENVSEYCTGCRSLGVKSEIVE